MEIQRIQILGVRTGPQERTVTYALGLWVAMSQCVSMGLTVSCYIWMDL